MSTFCGAIHLESRPEPIEVGFLCVVKPETDEIIEVVLGIREDCLNPETGHWKTCPNKGRTEDCPNCKDIINVPD